jgi:ABC-2 type transport system permease protein
MLVVSIVNERERHVYDLFVIRPIERRDIVLSKFMAVFVCVSIAVAIALVLGLVVDNFNSDTPIDVILDQLLDSVIISMSALAVVSAAGVLIGIVSPSMLVGVILVIYGGNQISGGIAVAAALLFDSHIYTVVLSIVLTVLLLAGSIAMFNRQQF